MRVKKLNYRGFPELDFTNLGSWDAFDGILTILKERFAINIIEQIDGPDSRLCSFEMDGYKFMLCNEPDGNSIRSMEDEDKDIYINWLMLQLDNLD